MFSFFAYLIGGIWIVENWQIIVAVLAIIILLIIVSRRSKKKKAAQYAQVVRQQEEERKQTQQPTSPPESAPVKSSAPKKAQTAPEEIEGKQLAYRYTDVRFSLFDPSAKSGLIGKELTFSEGNNKIGIFSDGTLLGAMAEGKLCDMVSDWLENGDPIFALLTRTDSSGNAFFDLFFYRSEMERLLLRHQDAKAYKLTGNKSAEYQDGLSFCSVGEECSVDYDYEKEKYAVSTSYADLGFLPASAARLIDDDPNQSIRVFIADLDEDDNGKTIVSVYVFSE